MDEKVKQALAQGRTIDITTTGKTTGLPRPKEIWFHNLDGHIYITGTPGRRGWYANMVAHPEFTFHLKEGVKADLPARARPITDKTERRAALSRIVHNLGREQELESWIAHSPLVEVTFER